MGALTASPDPVHAKLQQTMTPLFPKLVHEIGWWTPHVESTARTYYPWKGSKYGWCQPTNSTNFVTPLPPDDVVPKGLLYIKTHKTSSSTCAGINIGIARHVARRLQQKSVNKNGSALEFGFSLCEHYDQHVFARHKRYLSRNRNESLLWTFVRHPRSRDISYVYFFQVSFRGVSPNDTGTLIDVLATQQSSQTAYIDAGPPMRNNKPKSLVLNPTDAIAHMGESIFEKYDFIGVLERRLESLAVITLLWDLDPTDVIVFSSNQAGTYYARPRTGTCIKIHTANQLHPRIHQYLNSPEYMDQHADFLLYYAADASLDRTIEHLGSERVKGRALLIRQLELLAKRHCSNKVTFECSMDGYRNTLNDCYYEDMGCGYECIDKVMEEFKQGSLSLD